MAKASKKSSAKKPVAKTAAKVAAKKPAAKPAAKAAAKKPAAKKAAAKPVKKAATKSAAKVAAKTSAKKATAPKAAAKTTVAKTSAAKTTAAKATPKAASEKKSAVTQVTDALKSVANKVTSAFTTDTKKKVLSKSDLAGVFAPTDDRIVIERMGVSNRTAGGLYIPDTVSDSEKPNRGRVLAVGPGHRDKKGRLRPLDVQQGDVVIFDRYAGSEVKIADQEFVLLRESEVVAVEKA